MTEIRNVAVIGAGLMGHALALVHAVGGCKVTMQDVNAEQLAAAPGLVAAALGTLIDGGAVSADRRADILGAISTTPDMAECVGNADLIVEAVVENADVKREVYVKIEAAAPKHAILASNTSHLDIFPLVPEGLKSRAAIAHWYTPPYIIDLVDVVAGPEADANAGPTLRDLYAGMGKKPVLFKQMIPGYVANRLQAAMSLEIYNLLDEGLVEPADIDDSIKYGLAIRMALLGHLKKADYTGIDMIRRAMANGGYSAPAARPNSPSIDKLVEQGRLGTMYGAGFYDYGGRPPAELFQARDRGLLKLKAQVEEIEQAEEI